MNANPSKVGPRQENMSWKVVGLNPGAGSRYFLLMKSRLKCLCTIVLQRILLIKYATDVECINCFMGTTSLN